MTATAIRTTAIASVPRLDVEVLIQPKAFEEFARYRHECKADVDGGVLRLAQRVEHGGTSACTSSGPLTTKPMPTG